MSAPGRSQSFLIVPVDGVSRGSTVCALAVELSLWANLTSQEHSLSFIHSNLGVSVAITDGKEHFTYLLTRLSFLKWLETKGLNDYIRVQRKEKRRGTNQEHVYLVYSSLFPALLEKGAPFEKMQ